MGRYKATNAVVTATTSSEYVTFKNATASKEVIDIDEVAEFDFEFTVDASCPMTEKFHVDFSLVADNDKTANGSCVLTNVCDVVFTLKDQFGDGWAKSAIEVKYDDGTPTDTLTMFDGDLLAIEKGIALGTKVTVSFIKAKYNSYECSYTIEYKDGELIYDSGKNLKEGLHCEFVTNCIDTTNVNEIEVNNVKFDVYPNPATDVINITSNALRYEYQMINSLGQVVLEGVSSEDNTISVANMQNGIYFLKLVADGEMKINKIIIQ